MITVTSAPESVLQTYSEVTPAWHQSMAYRMWSLSGQYSINPDTSRLGCKPTAGDGAQGPHGRPGLLRIHCHNWGYLSFGRGNFRRGTIPPKGHFCCASAPVGALGDYSSGLYFMIHECDLVVQLLLSLAFLFLVARKNDTIVDG